jgi:hypothetical protein
MGRAGSADLPDGESEIFFEMGLDRANQIEMLQEIRLCAHARRRAFAPVGWRVTPSAQSALSNDMQG